jgi:zinc protease
MANIYRIQPFYEIALMIDVYDTLWVKRTLIRLCLISALLAGSSAACSQPASSGVVQTKLANGLTLIVKPDRRAPTAVHMVWHRVGAMDEVDGTSGVAHVLEHMMFKGTKTTKPGEFSKRVAALGGRDNAFTGQDYTGYFQIVPATALQTVMKLEADRFANNAWSDEEFRKELEVVKEERRLRTEDNPRALLYEALNATSFSAAPYRRPVVGWMSDLEAMTPEDVRSFYKRWYTPANAAVIVVGDVDARQVLKWAQRYYGTIPVHPLPPRKPREEPEQKGIKRLVLKAPADQAYVALAFKAPALKNLVQPTPADRDALALTVLSAVLDGYSGSRLDRALMQGEDRLADQAGASSGLYGRGPQQFVIYGVPAGGKTAVQLEDALRQQVQRVAQDGVAGHELQRVKTQWVASEVYKRDSMMGQVMEMGAYWIQGLPVDSSALLTQRLREVTAEQVQSVAQRYFGDDQLTVAHLLPQPVDPKRVNRPVHTSGRH